MYFSIRILKLIDKKVIAKTCFIFMSSVLLIIREKTLALLMHLQMQKAEFSIIVIFYNKNLIQEVAYIDFFVIQMFICHLNTNDRTLSQRHSNACRFLKPSFLLFHIWIIFLVVIFSERNWHIDITTVPCLLNSN